MRYQAARRYAQALFDVCEGTPDLDAVNQDLSNIAGILKKSVEFKILIDNPIVSKEVQTKTLKKLFQKKINSITLKYLYFLVQKERLSLLEDICAQFECLYFDSKNIAKVTIYSSVSLSKKQKTVIVQHLSNKLKKKIEPTHVVRPEMIGGVKVRIGDDVYDYTVQTQLEEFRQAYLETA